MKLAVSFIQAILNEPHNHFNLTVVDVIATESFLITVYSVSSLTYISYLMPSY